MADEYIKKSDVKKAMDSKYADDMRKYPEFVAWLKSAVNIVISEIPAADVQPVKRGKLEERIGYGGWGDTYYHCSVCGSDWVFEEGTPKANEWNFCPHCGADVRSSDATKG